MQKDEATRSLDGVTGSWVGAGRTCRISAEQLQQVLGKAQVQAIAQIK
jgi:uncharacterized protein YidB (DUF937 family)